MRPFLRTWLLNEIEEENIKGPDIVNHFIEHVGTREDLFNKYWLFGDLLSAAPVGKQIEAERARREGRETPEPEVQGPEEIPMHIRQKISDELTSQGFKHSDDNYWKVYNKYKINAVTLIFTGSNFHART
jgi:hypothetical protein